MKRIDIGFTLFAMLLLQSVGLSPNPGEASAQEKTADGPLRDPKTGFAFSEIPDFQRSKLHTYSHPSLGVSVDYHSKAGLKATIYIYNLGIEKIPEGIESKAVKDQMKKATQDVFAAQKQGHYESVLQLSSGTLELGTSSEKKNKTFSAMKMVFLLRREKDPKVSEIYLLGYKNHFVKVRSTYPVKNFEQCGKDIDRFTKALGTMLQKEQKNKRAEKTK